MKRSHAIASNGKQFTKAKAAKSTLNKFSNKKAITSKFAPKIKNLNSQMLLDDGDDEESDAEGEQVPGEFSAKMVKETGKRSENTMEIEDDSGSSVLLAVDDKEGITKMDVFHERFIKNLSESDIGVQLKANKKIGGLTSQHSHDEMGSITAYGAAAVGMSEGKDTKMKGVIGIAQSGIDSSGWNVQANSDNDTPSPGVGEFGLRKVLLEKFAFALQNSSKEGDAKKKKTKRFKPSQPSFTQVQESLLKLFLSYADVLYQGETIETHQDIVRAYMLHAINHIYRSRMNVYRNSLKKKENATFEAADQGFSRPRVLILTPMRNTAYDAVEFLCDMEIGELANYESFANAFIGISATEDKPKDFQYVFRDNLEDCYTLGIAMRNDGSLSLDVPNLYHSDIIFASPVGLRLLIGTPDDPKRNFDFLSSLEMVIVDQMDVMLMQNWSHLTLVLDHLNLKPTSVRPGMDFSRMDEWSLSGNSKHRRQTILLSAFPYPDINAVFNRKCDNTFGKIKITPLPSGGTIERVIPQIKQTFQRLDCGSIDNLDEQRFKLFTDEVYPHLSSTLPSRILLFVPSYFDFLRIRDHFTKDREPYCQANEYMKPKRIASQIKNFGKRNVKWLLCTERCYYFRRITIPKIRHVVFYSPPLNAHFYNELLNTVESNDATSIVLYTKFEKLQLERLTGYTRTQKMLTSNKNTFLFC